jgi:hypothetical protein
MAHVCLTVMWTRVPMVDPTGLKYRAAWPIDGPLSQRGSGALVMLDWVVGVA